MLFGSLFPMCSRFVLDLFPVFGVNPLDGTNYLDTASDFLHGGRLLGLPVPVLHFTDHRVNRDLDRRVAYFVRVRERRLRSDTLAAVFSSA